jgi:glycosyltransferase involved in cell wall biosynthesis
MNIKIMQFLYQNHSWSVCGWNICRSLLKLNHIVDLYPTDKDKTCYLPEYLKPYQINKIDKKYDMQISYTAPINFQSYLLDGKSKRYGMWAYEFGGKNTLPEGFAKYHKYTDKILVPSNFCRQIFIDSHIPQEKVITIPHGIHLEDFENKTKYTLKTNKKIKYLVVIGQPHARKNISGIFEAWGRAFNKTDDACLVFKVNPQKEKIKKHMFDVDFYEIYNEFLRKYKNHAEIEIITEFIPNMVELTNACNIMFSMSNCEGFYIPGIDALGANIFNICPNYGGQLDFLNNKNSLLIKGVIVRAKSKYTYWNSNPYAQMFEPNIDHAAELLKKAYNEYDSLLLDFMPSILETREVFTWDNAVKKILEIQ